MAPRSKASTIAAIDVRGGLPFKRDIRIDGVKAANAKHLPPLVTLQCQCLPDARLQPYVGAGVNYTWFFDEQLNGNDTNLQIES